MHTKPHPDHETGILLKHVSLWCLLHSLRPVRRVLRLVPFCPVPSVPSSPSTHN